MKKSLLMGLVISLFAVSCKKNAEPTQTQQDTVAVLADTLSAQVDSIAVEPIVEEPVVAPISIGYVPENIKLSEEMTGCGCGYSKSKKENNSYKMIYIDNTGDAVMYLDGVPQWFSVENNSDYLNNGEYEISISTKKVGDMEEGAILQGSMTITRLSDGAKETTKIYGGCGC